MVAMVLIPASIRDDRKSVGELKVPVEKRVSQVRVLWNSQGVKTSVGGHDSQTSIDNNSE